MSILATVRTRLAADADLVNLAVGGIYVDISPPEEYRPHVVFYGTYEDTEDCLTHFESFQSASLRFEAIATSRALAEDVITKVEAALNGYRGRHAGENVFVNGVKRKSGRIQLVDSPQDGTDQWLFRTIMNFDFNYNFV